MNIDEILKSHEQRNQSPFKCSDPDCYECGWLDRESTLIAMVHQLEADKAGLVGAIQYALDDEPNLIPRATSHCRIILREALKQHGNK